MNALVLPGEARLIGPALRRLRVSLNLNQAHLVAAGVANQGVISGLENARKMPLLPTVSAYLAAMGCALAVVRVDGSDIPPERNVTRVVLNPRRGPLGPRPRRPAPARRRVVVPQFTNTGRCLACFKIHKGRPCE